MLKIRCVTLAGTASVARFLTRSATRVAQHVRASATSTKLEGGEEDGVEDVEEEVEAVVAAVVAAVEEAQLAMGAAIEVLIHHRPGVQVRPPREQLYKLLTQPRPATSCPSTFTQGQICYWCNGCEPKSVDSRSTGADQPGRQDSIYD